jgi:hypothetical protein
MFSVKIVSDLPEYIDIGPIPPGLGVFALPVLVRGVTSCCTVNKN